MNNNIVIVDGNSLINRAFFAMSDLKNSNGIYTGGVHGLTSMVLSLIENFSPTHFCVAFDMKGPTIRHLAYEDYKGTRKGMPPELAMQMPIVKEVLDALNIPRIELQGYEADDLIGTIARLSIENDIEANVITGDKDALQLVAFGTKVYITKKGISQLKLYDENEIFEELGVSSSQVIDYKGLSGDASDNIPGIPGVGPKTAAKLLSQFGTVEQLILNVDEVENKRIQGLVREYAEQAVLSKKLVTIITYVPADFELNRLILNEPDVDKAIQVFKKYELSSLISKLKVQTVVSKVSAKSYELITAEELLKILSKTSEFAFKLYFNRSDYKDTILDGAAFYVDNNFYLLKSSENFHVLKPIFENENIHKYGYDLKNEYLFLMSQSIDLVGVTFDGFIAAYLIEPSRRSYDVSEIIFEYTSIKLISQDELLGKGAKRTKYEGVDAVPLYEYMTAQLHGVEELRNIFLPKLSEMELTDLFNDVEIPLVKILADIEYTGFKVDQDELDKINKQLIEKIAEIEKTIFEMSGEEFNINSPKQLGVILFEKLELPAVKKTKTGYSTGHDVLEKLINKHPIISEIIEYRTYTKLKSTYIDGLKAVIDLNTSRVHTSLNQTIAVTGRLSSTEPNLQNIPVKLPYGRKIRKFFIADEGCTLLDADYSQIELRVLAHLSKDETLIKAFKNDLDIHAITASQVFGIEENEVTSLQRRRAKEVNFGIVYGMGEFGLSENLGISRKEAKTYIEKYFESYPKIKGFMDDIIVECKEKGYVETILKRKRTIQDINHSNFMMRSAAERIARNTPIQGSAADIIKIAMIKVFNALNKKKLHTKLILQVHDELILNVPMNELDDVKVILQECMEEAYQLIVPLKIDMNTGESWYDAK